MPRAGIAIAARGNDQRRTRRLKTSLQALFKVTSVKRMKISKKLMEFLIQVLAISRKSCSFA